MKTQENTIPIANLDDYLSEDIDRKKKFVDVVGSSLRDIGFFAIVGHGLTDEFIGDAYRKSEELFLKPDNYKKSFEIDQLKGQRGFISFGKEHAKDSDAPDLKEFWHIGQEKKRESYPDNVWPQDITGFREVMLEFYEKLEKTSFAILEACSSFVGEAPRLMREVAEEGNTILRLIHYPPIADDAHPASIRAAAHEDINLITLLVDASTPGLELLDRNGNWLPVVTPKNSIIVDSGDMLQNLSNGFYKATTHRVTNPKDSRSRRFSMPFFVHARSEVPLDPLASCVKKTGGVKKFPDITAGDYLNQRLKEIGLG